MDTARRTYTAVFAGFVALTLTSASAPLVKAESSAQAASEEETVQLPTFQVEATLRSEPLLNVPIPVAVVTGEQLLDLQLENISDVTEMTPSLTFRAGSSNKDTSLLIRGVGTITTSPGAEPDVSTVVDGVALARPGQATMDLVDVDHIEVLRGPQGTLFGKNSSVGAVNVVTKDPSDKKQGYIDAAYFAGNNEEIIHAGISGPIEPGKLFASFALLFDQYDGNVHNIYENQQVNGFRNWGFRTKLLYTPSSTFKATFIASYVNSYSTAPAAGPFVEAYNITFPTGVFKPASAAALATIAPVVPSPDNLTVNSSLLGHVYDQNGGVSANMEWTLSDYKLNSISAYQHWFNNQFEDTQIAAVPTVGQTVSHDMGFLYFDQYSEELRLTSPTGKLLEYVAGLYFENAKDSESYRRDIIQETAAFPYPINNSGDAHYGTTGDTYAVYGEGTWHLAPAVRLVTGFRETHDTLDFYHSRISSSAVSVPGINPTLAYHTGSTSANGFSGRASLQYDVNKDAMVFVTYTRGYKGPAYNVFFNQTALQVGALNPETSDDYEAGIKAAALNNRLQFTVTAFDTIYHNYQANFATLVSGTPVTNLINAGQVSSKGVEADFRARLNRNFTLSGSGSYVDAKVDSFNTPPGTTSVNGQPLPFAPHWKENINLEYHDQLNKSTKVFANTNYQWQSQEIFQLTETPDTIQPSYGIWNASFGFAWPDEGLRVTFFCKNITDTHYATLLTELGGMVWRNVPRDDQRYFGFSVRKEF
jgi:iron complex outermembrane recepter protein